MFQTCLEKWPNRESERIYFIIANLLMCYLLPLSIISVCYWLIWRRVNQRRPPGERQHKTDKIVHKSKVKVVKMLITVIVLFTFSWLPLYSIFARIKLGAPIDSEIEETVIFICLPFAQWLGASNSCINPILYAYFNRKFRLGFRAIVYSRSCCSTLYSAPSGSDLRTYSSKQSLFLSSVNKFQHRKTKSCAMLFSNNVKLCDVHAVKPLSYPNLTVSLRSVSLDNLFTTAKPTKQFKDTLL